MAGLKELEAHTVVYSHFDLSPTVGPEATTVLQWQPEREVQGASGRIPPGPEG